MSFLPPLFDRLVLEDKGLLDEAGLKASIQKEVSLLFNTRSALRQYAPEGQLKGYFIFPELFGLRDFSSFTATHAHDWLVIERDIEFSLQAFEPRLKNPSVKIQGFDPKKQQISLTIGGEMFFGKRVESISFPLNVEVKHGTGL